MASALIGYSGFVGGNLRSQQSFDDFYNSGNIAAIAGKRYERIVCAGVPAAKWIANREPEQDRENIERLAGCLESVEAGKFILISTVDVYPDPVGVDEGSDIDIGRCQPYGKHRLWLERFVAGRFNSFIIRLPGLFGRGLKKNIIYDFLHANNLEQINPNGQYQFYYLEHLSRDIDTGLRHGLELLNVTSEPTRVGEVARICLGHEFENAMDAPAARYDFHSRHAALFGGHDGYLYDKAQVLADLGEFVAREGMPAS